MRVTFLAGTLGRGGAERQLLYMLRALQKTQVETNVLSLTRGEVFENQIQSLGIPIEWISPKLPRAGKLARIIHFLKKHPADLIQSVHFYTNLYVAAAARSTGSKDIGAIRNDLFSELKANGVLGHIQLRAPRHLIANTRLARERAIGSGIKPDRIDVIPNVVDADTNNLDKRDRFDPSAVTILFVGRLTEQKRVDRFLRVLSRLKELVPNQKVLGKIAGDGPLRPQLEAMAQELNLTAKALEFCGDCDDIDARYGEADIVVLTSDWEGSPNALLEAMSRGLPVVATRVGGVPEVVGENRGFMVAPEDEKSLANVTARLVRDSHLRRELGRSGRIYTSSSHSIEGLGDRLQSVYRKVLLV